MDERRLVQRYTVVEFNLRIGMKEDISTVHQQSCKEISTVHQQSCKEILTVHQKSCKEILTVLFILAVSLKYNSSKTQNMCK